MVIKASYSPICILLSKYSLPPAMEATPDLLLEGARGPVTWQGREWLKLGLKLPNKPRKCK